MNVLRYLLQYQEEIPCEQLVMRLCDLKQQYTQFGGNILLHVLCLSGLLNQVKGHLEYQCFTWVGISIMVFNYTRVNPVVTMVAGKPLVLAIIIRQVHS